MTLIESRVTLLVCVTANVLCLPMRADADVVEAEFLGPFVFTYRIAAMPDFDLRRNESKDLGISGLPFGGNMYCAPTSTLNLMAYISAHGYPGVNPGVAPWQSPGTYEIITGLVFMNCPITASWSGPR